MTLKDTLLRAIRVARIHTKGSMERAESYANNELLSAGERALWAEGAREDREFFDALYAAEEELLKSYEVSNG